MKPDEGVGQLRAFFNRWPVGMQFTTRGIQVGAGIPDLLLAEEAAEQLRAQGLLVMESIGATHLWRRCEPVAPPAAVEVPPGSIPTFDATSTTARSATLSVG
ncbi:MAG: hypothetical protein AB7R89_12165 [Dehalococcoidia bacterium]